MFELTIDTSNMISTVQRIAETLRLNLGDFRDLFRDYDAWLSKHIQDNFDKEGPNWAPLARSTRAARGRGLKYGTAPAWHRAGGGRTGSTPSSYYRSTRPMRRASEAHPIGVWTGRARRRAIKKGKALRSKYVRDFGPEDETRDRLHWLHTGGPHRQPRPLYRNRVLEKQLERMAQEYGNTLISKVDEALEGLGTDILDRLRGRFQ